LSVTQNLGPQCSLRRFSHLRLCVPLLAALIAMGCARSRPAAVGIPGAPMPNAGASSPAPPIASTPAQPESSPVPVESEPAPVAPSTFVQQGVASWYGKPFNGRHASDGEIYHMNDAVAAHRTLPFGSMVRVTNLNNGLHTDVRIIDRGPFVHGRIIDLSRAAARAIQMIGPGTAPVRIELLSSPAPLTGDFTVQVGAFEQQDNADRVRDQMLGSYPVFVQEYDAPDGHFYRVRVGRVSTQEAADALAARLTSEHGFHTFVVRLDQAR